ncbi:unnamed protein product [Bursaphelenchus xylophilus]|uniref:(pine wood nematode) hypothetical protein n=1 Tax=Bursaphelenchus xylophilus TaxID=6326 RepID=A0A1I7RHN9_BURXY|nr:unnamed protein product [Bursaphelenchus xylophilus]CAG9115544.1 unnamed protein product [Bursaphelenchus xylophilus]
MQKYDKVLGMNPSRLGLPEAPSSSTLAGNVSSTQNIIEHDQLGAEVYSTRVEGWRKVVLLLKNLKNPLVIVLAPFLLSTLLQYHRRDYDCAFVVALMAIYWVAEVMPLPITALMPLFMFPLIGILPAKAVAKEYLNDTNFLFIGGLVMAVAVEKCHLHERMALSVLTMVGSKPQWIMLGFMVATAALSMFISNTATTAMMVPIGQSVIEQLLHSKRLHGMSETSKTELLGGNFEHKPSKAESLMSKGLIISICFAANIGGTGTVTGTPPNLVVIGMLSTLFQEADTGVHYLSWIAFAFPLMILCLLACWSVLVLLFMRDAPPADPGVIHLIKKKYEDLPPMSFAEKSVGASFLVLLVLWIGRDPHVVPGFGSYFPKGYFTDATSAMLVAVLLFILPSDIPTLSSLTSLPPEGKKKKSDRLMDWTTMHSKFPWSVVLLLGGGFALAAGVKESGLSHGIGLLVSKLAGLPPVALQLISLVVTMLVTNICSNTVAASIFLPIAANLAQQTELNPLSLMLPTTLAASYAFVLPVGTPPNAIVFASGYLKVTDMIISGTFVSIACTLIVVGYMNTLAMLVFPLNEFPAWAAMNETMTS